MTMTVWLIIGVSGVSRSGKTTVTKSLLQFLSDSRNRKFFGANNVIGSVHCIEQDEYFYPLDHPNHEHIKHLDYMNWERLESIDTHKMHTDIERIIGANPQYWNACNANVNDTGTETVINVTIVEGFLIFNDAKLNELCQLKFFINASYETIFQRRNSTPWRDTDDLPDPPTYFEDYLWPAYLKNFNAIEHRNEIIMLSGDDPRDIVFQNVLQTIEQTTGNRTSTLINSSISGKYN